MSQELSTFNQKDIEESQAIAGQTSSNKMPFVPIVTVNNKSEKKMATIDGQEQEVEVPAKKGFLMLEKDDKDELTEKFLPGDISGVVLKERFMIAKKYAKGQDQFKSDEFDTWTQPIRLYDTKDRKKTIYQGTYSNIKEVFTSVDNQGKAVKLYDLFLILYVNLEASGTIVRLKVKMTRDNNWFDYKNDFASDEPWAGYITHFKLLQKVVGDITYWHINFERGEQVNLSDQLTLQKELNNYFSAINSVKAPVKKDSNEVSYTDENKTSQIEEPASDPYEGFDNGEEIKIEDIPF